MRTKLLITICAVMAIIATSCRKEWEWSVPLAVNSTELNIPSNLAGYIYVPVYSTITWQVGFDFGDGPQWLHADRTSGKGYNVCIKVDYDANPNPEERSADMIISPKNSSKVQPITIHLTQPATK